MFNKVSPSVNGVLPSYHTSTEKNQTGRNKNVSRFK